MGDSGGIIITNGVQSITEA